MAKKILLLADINSSHTQKWAVALRTLHYPVEIFSLNVPHNDWCREHGIRVTSPTGNSTAADRSTDFGKLHYLSSFASLKKVIRSFRPDVIHAHYATSYGLLGALSGFHPLIISVWGSDVMNFPLRSPAHRLMLKYNLNKADLVIATGSFLKDIAQQYTGSKTMVFPLGVDTSVFFPARQTGSSAIRIGTVKSLEKIYGIDTLINAFALVCEKYGMEKLHLSIAGGGTLEEDLKSLAGSYPSLNIHFTGKLAQAEVPSFINSLDIFVCPSIRESFGVSVLEASACGVPIVVSDIPGLREVLVAGKTALVAKAGDVNSFAGQLGRLIEDPVLRNNMGKAGRKFVEDNFNWSKNIYQISDIYAQF